MKPPLLPLPTTEPLFLFMVASLTPVLHYMSCCPVLLYCDVRFYFGPGSSLVRQGLKIVARSFPEVSLAGLFVTLEGPLRVGHVITVHRVTGPLATAITATFTQPPLPLPALPQEAGKPGELPAAALGLQLWISLQQGLP